MIHLLRVFLILPAHLVERHALVLAYPLHGFGIGPQLLDLPGLRLQIILQLVDLVDPVRGLQELPHLSDLLLVLLVLLRPLLDLLVLVLQSRVGA